MAAVSNLQVLHPTTWIPPSTTAVHRLTIERQDGTVDDVTERTFQLEIEDGTTEMIGRFEFTMFDPNSDYAGLWHNMDIVRYYSDYESTATSLRFRGRIEKIDRSGNQLTISGRSEARKLMDITVTDSFPNERCSAILYTLLRYTDGFTFSDYGTEDYWDPDEKYITVNWVQKPFWDCIKELCTANNYDFYVDSTLNFNFFPKDSRTNNGEAIVHTYNLLETKEFAEDITYVRNRIIVYGADDDSIQVLYTAEDADSQDKYGIREEIINDSNITSTTQAQEYAEYILASKKDPPQIGTVQGLLLASIQPGEKIWLSDPDNGILPSAYSIISYKHKIDFSRGLTTEVKVNKESRRFSNVLASIITTANQQQSTSNNPYEMRYSYDFTFDSDSGTHVNTSIANSLLVPAIANGYWTSASKILTTDVREVYLVMNGETLNAVTVQVSGNDGQAWETITNRTRLVLTSTVGKLLRIRVTFTSADAQLQSLQVLYKTG
jgi:hypothetical protein